MKCPVCNSNLIKMDRQGVEIDFCPQYCGVWLDRGELEKIIERSIVEQRPFVQRRDDDDDRDHKGDRDRQFIGERDDDHRHKPRRKSFLDEIFDFD